MPRFDTVAQQLLIRSVAKKEILTIYFLEPNSISTHYVMNILVLIMISQDSASKSETNSKNLKRRVVVKIVVDFNELVQREKICLRRTVYTLIIEILVSIWQHSGNEAERRSDSAFTNFFYVWCILAVLKIATVLYLKGRDFTS